MGKRIKLFPNMDNEKSLLVMNMLSEKLRRHGYEINNVNFDLAIAIGGDGSYLRMVRNCNFSEDVYYIGVNTGTLGFLQEVMPDSIDLFLDNLSNELYKIDKVSVQETSVTLKNKDIFRFESLNEMGVKNAHMSKADFMVNVNGSLLENFSGDGLLVCTTIGSTAYNRNLNGAIVYRGFDTLQLTPIAGDNSSAFRTLNSSVVFPANTKIELIPMRRTNDLYVFYDTENLILNDVEKVETGISKKKIRCLRLNDYDYAKIIQDKLLK